MATKYADFDLGTGNNDGSDWTNAWKTMADAIAGSNSAPPAAGDTVLCRGTDTVLASPTNTLDGTMTDPIRWIGVNASGSNDGTRATINANGGNFAAFSIDGSGYNWYENFRFTGSGNSDGVDTPGNLSSFNWWINCSFDNNTGRGMDSYFSTAGAQYNFYFRCTFYNNAAGVGVWANDRFAFCSFHDLTSSIHDGGSFVWMFGCVAYDIGNFGLYQPPYATIINCVFDNCNKAWDGYDGVNHSWAFMNRFTNNAVGFDGNNYSASFFANVFDGNVDHLLADSKVLHLTLNGTNLQSELNENGAGGGDTNQGYVSLTEGSEDYSTNYVSGTDPHLRRTAITIPVS